MSMTAQKLKRDLTTGPIHIHLIKMTLPMIWGILAIVSFQLVDAYYISHLGTAAMAAFSYTFPVTYGLFSIFIGFGIAMSSVISRFIGAGQMEDVKRVTSHGILLVFIVSLLAAAIGIPMLEPLFRLMGASETEIGTIKEFMVIYFLGTFFVSMPVVGNASLRATGDAMLPALIMTIAAIINALINPVLIFGLFGFPRMEMFGAALGTVIANFGAMVAGLTLMYRKGLFDFSHLRNLLHFSDSAKRLLMIALPAGITSMFPAFLGSVITGLLSRTGENSQGAVAAFGAASRVEALTMVILMALSIGMAPIIGQNWGAKLFGRVQQTIRYAIFFCIGWSAFVAIILVVFAEPLALSFVQNDEPDNGVAFYNYLVFYFTLVPLSYIFANISHGWGSTFNAIGKPQFAAMLLFIKMILLMIPAAYIGAYWGGTQGVFIATAIINALSGIGIHLWSRHYFRNAYLNKLA